MSSKTSILDVLSRESPKIDASYTKSGTNSAPRGWPHIERWSRWEDFNAQNLYKMYRPIVDADWVSDMSGWEQASQWDQRVFDEDSLDHYLSRFMLPHVNAALGHARRVLSIHRDNDLSIGRGGRCYYGWDTERSFKPDWSLCSDSQRLDDEPYRSLLPGDTKLSAKWRSDMYGTTAHAIWKDPVRQILHYITELKMRYGWLITDAELVVFRVSVDYTGPGQTADRPPRQQPPASHGRRTSTDTDVSQLSSGMQSVSLNESSSYVPSDNGVDAFRLEYQTIPWRSHGNGRSQLNIRLALFYLAMISGYGARSLLPAYPGFDSWWWGGANGDPFTHNTTGQSSKEAKALEYPDPNGPRGPETVTFTSETDEESADFLTRASVRTLDVDPRRQQPYYDVVQSDEQGNQIIRRIFVHEETLVYDEDSGQYGRFRGLVWVPQTAEPESSGRKRHGERPSKPGKRKKK